MNKQIQRALTYATKKHKGQFYGTKPFIYHPKQVYEIVSLIAPQDIPLRQASLLHDILEDCPSVSYSELEERFGLDVASLVKEVTKTAYNTFPDLKTQRGYQLKFSDRLANLSNLDSWSERRIALYLQKSVFWEK